MEDACVCVCVVCMQEPHIVLADSSVGSTARKPEQQGKPYFPLSTPHSGASSSHHASALTASTRLPAGLQGALSG